MNDMVSGLPLQSHITVQEESNAYAPAISA